MNDTFAPDTDAPAALLLPLRAISAKGALEDRLRFLHGLVALIGVESVRELEGEECASAEIRVDALQLASELASECRTLFGMLSL
jgi:hypothetical protein